MTTEHQYHQMKLMIIALLVLNALLGIYIAFFKHDALRLETMKAGGRANMQMAKQLYSSDVYIQQQQQTLEGILGSLNQAANTPTVDAVVPTVDTTETPAVAQ
jgi:hypothetical protein